MSSLDYELSRSLVMVQICGMRRWKLSAAAIVSVSPDCLKGLPILEEHALVPWSSRCQTPSRLPYPKTRPTLTLHRRHRATFSRVRPSSVDPEQNSSSRPGSVGPHAHENAGDADRPGEALVPHESPKPALWHASNSVCLRNERE
jgi:hypothetical protein